MKLRRLALLALAASTLALSAAACDDSSAKPDAIADATPDADLDSQPEILAPPTSWSSAVTVVQLIADQTLSGDLSDGAVIDLDWADEPTVNCWTFSAQQRFAGPHVLYALAVPLAKTKRLQLTLTPSAGVDANLYALAQTTDGFYVPPDMPAARECRPSDTGGAGEVEGLTLQNITGAQNWLFAVAAPAGVTAGAYTLRVEDLTLPSR